MKPPHEHRRELVLLDTRDERGTMFRAAKITDDGSLVIFGHDLGSGVEEALGAGEYEFERRLCAADVARLRGLLHLTPGDDLLEVIDQRLGSSMGLEAFLAVNGIHGRFWNRIGD